MASTFTTRKLLEKQGNNDNSNTWDVPLNVDLDDIDQMTHGLTTKSVAGGSDVTLSEDEALSRILVLTGALTGNISVIVPARESAFKVYNNTSGSFTLILKPSGGAGLVLPQGSIKDLYTSGSVMFEVGDAQSVAQSNFGTTGNTANTQTLALSPAIRDYRPGLILNALIGSGLTTTNTSPTIDVNGKGALNLKQSDGSALTIGGELLAGAMQRVLYDGSSVRILDLPWKTGTFTPSVSSTGSYTYAAQNGLYFRLGPIVLFDARVVLASISGVAGGLTLTGLPYNAAQTQYSIKADLAAFSWNVYPNIGTATINQVNSGSKTLVIQLVEQNGTVSIATAGLQNTTQIQVAGFYFTKDPL